MKNIGLFFGGQSVEHDVSVVSAQIISGGFAELSSKYHLIPIYVNPDGQFIIFKKFPSLKELKQKMFSSPNVSVSVSPASQKLIFKKSFSRQIIIDLAFPLIHGTGGEDGSLQGFFETLNVPYVGPAVLGSAVGMDKIIFKNVMQVNKIPSVNYLWFSRDAWQKNQADIISQIESTLSYPLFVKPANLGSSIGITRSDDCKTLIEAFAVASRYASRIIIEQGIVNAREINCAVVGYKDPTPSELEEPLHFSDFLTFEDKYIGGGKGGSMKGLKNKVKIPAEVKPEIKKEIQDLAVKVFKLLGCAGVSRIDFLLSQDNKVFVNEINTIPGSLQQHLFKASGLKLSELIDQAISSSLVAYEDKSSNLTFYESVLLKDK